MRRGYALTSGAAVLVPLAAQGAFAALSITRAELNGGRLREVGDMSQGATATVSSPWP
jgi:hypothetical protein